jgi:hypothetical protein
MLATPTTLWTWERGVRRNGKLIASDLQEHIATIRTMAPQAQLTETCLERIAKAERVVPTMQATIAFVSGYVRQQVRQLDVAQPVSYAMHAHLIPAYDPRSGGLDPAGAPGRAAADACRAPPDPTVCVRGALGALSPMEQNQLKHKAKTLAEVFQRSSSNVEGRNGYLSLRNHQLRGLDHPRKRACLTAVHNLATLLHGPRPRSLILREEQRSAWIVSRPNP